MAKRIRKTGLIALKKYSGIYIRESESKSFREKPDRCFYFRVKHKGKLHTEHVGWASEGFTAALAQEAKLEFARKLKAGEFIKERKVDKTVDALFKIYFDSVSKQKKDQGVNDKSRYLNHLKVIGKKKLSTITLRDLERLHGKLKAKGLSDQTVIHVFKLLKAMYNKAIAWEIFDGVNPVTKLKLSKPNNQRVRYLSKEEAKLLLETLGEYPHVHDMALLSLGTGLRFGEIAKLRWTDVNFENNRVHIKDPKSGTDRFAVIRGKVKEMLEARKSNSSYKLVFPNSNGDIFKYTPKPFFEAFRELGFNDEADDTKDRVVFHTLRHTFASWLVSQGTPLFTVQRLMGHKDIQMTMRYAHLSPDIQAQAVEELVAGFLG